VVYSTAWCPDCKRAKKFFADHRIQYENVDIEKNIAGMDLVEHVNDGMRVVPTIVFPDGTIMSEPSNAELAEKLGVQTKASQTSYDTIIIGGGPSGLTSALYLSREGLDVLVIEKGAVGGQAGITQTLDNFPGFDEGISGAEFADRLGRQAKRFGTEVLEATDVTKVYKQGQYWMVETGDGSSYCSSAVLLATGARYRRMNIPGEEELIGINIHFCATCDGAFYKGKKVLVIGGGNSGFEEGLFLTKFADQVDIVEFAPEVKASKILQESVASKDHMQVFTNHAVKEFVGDGKLEKVIVEDRATGEIKEWEYDGVFVFIGLAPNTDLVKDLVVCDPGGFLHTDQTLMCTSPGLFAAGDVRAGSTKQAASAAGEGASAAIMIRQYLDQLG
jgi:thioredoxin reductase (NADPH)